MFMLARVAEWNLMCLAISEELLVVGVAVVRVLVKVGTHIV
jgi:hypothetical protein